MAPKAPTSMFEFPEDSEYRGIFIKREDLSETGSHKFRYFENKMKELKEQGVDKVVLSTTGNAGITASHYGKRLGVKVFCLMSDRGDMSKAAQIEKEGGFLVVTPRPVRFAKYIAKKYDIPYLRMSKDPAAVESYKSLGKEIIEQVPDAEAIVNFATSGTSSLGLMRAYQEAGLKLPALHIVQSGKSSSVVKALHPEQIPGDVEAKSVGLSSTPYESELLRLIDESGGDAHYCDKVQPRERGDGPSAAVDQDPGTSWEGNCSLQIAEKIKDRYRSIVVIFSGKDWPQVDFKASRRAEGFGHMDGFWQEFVG